MSDQIHTATSDAASRQASSAPIREIDVVADAPLALPNDDALLAGDFVRSGDDLRIEALDGSTTLLKGYFADGFTPDLVIGGAVLKGATITKLARQPREQAEEIEASWSSLDQDGAESGWGSLDQAVADATPLFARPEAEKSEAAAGALDLGSAVLGTEGAIAEITEAYGPVEIIRADGTRETAGAGTPIFEDDVLLTQAEGSVGITFLDGMSFSLGENAKMVFDEFAYDPANHSGGGVLSVLQGAFSFISGEAAHTAEDALMIETPTMTIGVRGTKVVSEIAPDGQTSRIAIMAEENGRIGKISVKTDKGEQILDKPNTMVEVTSRFEPPSEQREMTSAEAAQYFGSALSVLPAPTVDFRPEMIEAGYEAASAAMAAAAAATAGAEKPRASEAQAEQTLVEAAENAEETARADEPDRSGSGHQDRSSAQAAAENAGSISTASATAPQPAAKPAAPKLDVKSAAEMLEEDRVAQEVASANAPPINKAPQAGTTSPESTDEDSSYSYDSSPVFSDPDGDTLSYSATRADGSALPAWLSIDPATGVLSGTPANGDVGVLSIKITATDPSGASASATLDLTVDNVNDQPTVVSALTSTSTAEDAAFSLDVSGSFGDDDAIHGDSLTYSATQTNGSPLPAWLSIDPTTGVLSGTPDNGDVGLVQVRVTATDGSGASASSSFALQVTNTNDAPTVTSALVDASTAEDALFSLDTSTAFADDDLVHGDTLLFSATLADGSALPAWLSIDPNTGVLSGTPDNGDVGVLSVKVSATDSGDQTVSSTFALTITNVNDIPTVSGSIADATILEDAGFSLDTSAAFSDDDSIHGDTLSYSATQADGSALPGWLSFDTSTGVLSGTPLNGDVGTINVKVYAIDDASASASLTFAVTVTNVNDAPVVSVALSGASIAEDSPLSLDTASAFADDDTIHGDSLTYSATLADGSDLPSWLSINSSTGELTGTPLNGDVGAIDVKVTATDQSAVSASSTFTLTVTNTNDAPIVAAALSAASTAQDVLYSLDASTAFADDDSVHGDSLTYSATLADGSALPAWLSIDANTGVLSGTPTNGDVAAISVKVSATDGAGASANSTFLLTVTNVNDAPEVVEELADTTALEDSAWSLDTTSAFSDIDGLLGDVLGYTATLADGAALPAWLSFNGSTGVLSGTPDDGDVGVISVKVTAVDLLGLGASSTFDLTVQSVNDAPVLNSVSDPVFTTIEADDTSSAGDTIASLIVDGSITDADGNPVEAIALVGVDNTNGTWEYSLDGGATFLAAQPRSDTNALLLDETARLRFVPNEGYTGSATIEFRAWDKTTGSNGDSGVDVTGAGGSSAFSAVKDAAVITVTPDADATQGAHLGLGGAETTVNTTTADIQSSPSVGALAGGGHVVAWQSLNQDGSDYGIYAQRYDAAGAKVGSEFQVHSTTGLGQTDPQVVGLAGGGFVITWTHDSGGLNSKGVLGQRFSADGTKTGGEFVVNTYVIEKQAQSSVTALDDGGFVVVWESKGQDGDKEGIYLQRFNADGTKNGGETQVSTTTVGVQCTPEIASLAGGGWVVTWTSEAQDGSGYGIYAQRFASDGSKSGSEFRVNTFTTNDQIDPTVAGLADGGFVITWSSESQDGSNDGVYFQRYDSAGNTVGSETQVNTTTALAQTVPVIEALSDGGFVIAWQSDNQDGSEDGIYAQRYASDGTAIGGETLINATTTNIQSDIDFVVRADGSLAAVWTSMASGVEDIQTRVFETNNGPTLTASSDSESVAAEATINGALTGNDVDGDTLVYSILSQTSAGSKGVATIDSSTGAWSYTAADGASGSDTISYQVTDGNGGVDTVSITFTIT